MGFEIFRDFDFIGGCQFRNGINRVFAHNIARNDARDIGRIQAGGAFCTQNPCGDFRVEHTGFQQELIGAAIIDKSIRYRLKTAGCRPRQGRGKHRLKVVSRFDVPACIQFDEVFFIQLSQLAVGLERFRSGGAFFQKLSLKSQFARRFQFKLGQGHVADQFDRHFLVLKLGIQCFRVKILGGHQETVFVDLQKAFIKHLLGGFIQFQHLLGRCRRAVFIKCDGALVNQLGRVRVGLDKRFRRFQIAVLVNFDETGIHRIVCRCRLRRCISRRVTARRRGCQRGSFGLDKGLGGLFIQGFLGFFRRDRPRIDGARFIALNQRTDARGFEDPLRRLNAQSAMHKLGFQRAFFIQSQLGNTAANTDGRIAGIELHLLAAL